MAVVGALAVVWALVFEIFSRSGGASPSGREWIGDSGLFPADVCARRGRQEFGEGGLCEERKDGTLGLLFLTDLSGLDVVMGSFQALHQAFLVSPRSCRCWDWPCYSVEFRGADRCGWSPVSLPSSRCPWPADRVVNPCEGRCFGDAGRDGGFCFLFVWFWLVLDALLSVAGGAVVFPVFPSWVWRGRSCRVALVADPPAGSGTSRF